MRDSRGPESWTVEGRHCSARPSLIDEPATPEPRRRSDLVYNVAVATGLAMEVRRMASTRDVVGNHLKCFAERDLEGVLSDYSPDAVMFTSDKPLRGVAAIRPLFEAMIAEFRRPGAVFRMQQQFFEGDYAYILWTAETADSIYELGTDTFFVRDGKIVAQSFTAKVA